MGFTALDEKVRDGTKTWQLQLLVPVGTTEQFLCLLHGDMALCQRSHLPGRPGAGSRSCKAFSSFCGLIRQP